MHTEAIWEFLLASDLAAGQAFGAVRPLRQDGRIFQVFQRPIRNLVFACGPNAVIALHIGEEVIEHPAAVRMAIDAVVETDQASCGGGLLPLHTIDRIHL